MAVQETTPQARKWSRTKFVGRFPGFEVAGRSGVGAVEGVPPPAIGGGLQIGDVDWRKVIVGTVA